MPESFDLLPFQPDHIVAIKHGGATAEDNLAWSCYDCNIFKGPNVAGVDHENGRVTRLFHPRRDDWSAFFRYQGGILLGSNSEARTTIDVLRINLPRRVMLRRQLIAEGISDFGESQR